MYKREHDCGKLWKKRRNLGQNADSFVIAVRKINEQCFCLISYSNSTHRKSHAWAKHGCKCCTVRGVFGCKTQYLSNQYQRDEVIDCSSMICCFLLLGRDVQRWTVVRHQKRTKNNNKNFRSGQWSININGIKTIGKRY